MEISTMILVCIVLAVLILLTLLVFLGHLGLFSEVDVKSGTPPFRELTICYKFNRGPYKGCGHFFTEIYSIAPELKTIGFYYDDPERVNAYELRYAVGAILSDGIKPEPEGVRQRVARYGFKVATFPAIEHAVLASFPYKATLSIVLAIWKVYPALKEYIKRSSLCAWPMIELYDADEIRFVAPLTQQEDFLVPEATEEPAESDQRLTEDDEDLSADGGGTAAQSGSGEQPAPTGSGSSGSSFEDLSHAPTTTAAGDTL
ncbi:testis-expressed protein 264-like [Pollicipes pollicipes]|uniref:testis-expressed protein 264-like n=1 Tax=Pollicipes pollicipes TaxID=41117 RepID=UPI0018851F6A|nr:testis-expressed protein 264-like [Pollicipes pollicipes]XP_037070773.1 testis-expressed protein 264-like [Pollicipes pollicipes]XP_037070774.1 testis-expressed protein 264-like [Pollicipes pollicipes]XP_037070775.1 testis-expressed protein 264-like [Pollicipes pollicipes]XP_037070776.1 testis-expressed protein 264-like [Pollicipes pollicipes]XP_037070777.1 testis-expressed protein 264-like [Pollicipes pollicipes]